MNYTKDAVVGSYEDLDAQFFKDTYIQNKITPREAFHGCLFETYGPDKQRVVESMQEDDLAGRAQRVDTILEEKGEVFILRGYWAINTLGHLIRKEVKL